MVKARGDFTDILIRRGIIEPDQILEAKGLHQQTGAKLEDVIVKLGYATAQEVMSAIAESHGLQFIDLTEVTIPQSVVDLVPESVARENFVLPMAQENGALKIIMSDPSDFDTVQRLQFILNQDIQPVLASRAQIIEAIDRHYGQTETESVDSMLQEFTDEAIDFNESAAPSALAPQDDSDPRVVKLVNLIITEAMWLRASDIHIEPFADRIRVRYRIDGILVERDSLPRRLLDPLLSRIKFMSNIDISKRPQPQDGRIKRLLAPLLSRIKIKSNIAISERPQPQDGRIKMNVEGKHFDLRVSILPTNHGQSAVMRILDRDNTLVRIRDLGVGEKDNKRFQQIITGPNGIFLVTGLTGSGTTTTLYAALNDLNRPDRKIITAEDPVEYYLPGVNQVEVKHQIGLDFARIIRAMLLQGPDVIVVGEIRDHETAQIAVQAALSGPMVFSTLNTTDAPSAITRLVDIGVQPFLIASSVIAIMAQRLVRAVCPKCKEPDDPDTSELHAAGITSDQLANATFMRGRGCNHCHHTGYRGRLGIFELLEMSAGIREMTFNRAPNQEIRRQARLMGMRTLLEDGVDKAVRGITTLEEVLSACHHELETDVAAS